MSFIPGDRFALAKHSSTATKIGRYALTPSPQKRVFLQAR